MTAALHEMLGGPSALAGMVGRLMDHVADDPELFHWLDQHSFNDVRKVLHAVVYVVAEMPSVAEVDLIRKHISGWDHALQQCWARKVIAALQKIGKPMLENAQDRQRFEDSLKRFRGLI